MAMAFDAFRAKKPGLFEMPPRHDTPGYGGPMPGEIPLGNELDNPFPPQQAQQPIRPGMAFRAVGGASQAPVSLLPGDAMPEQQSQLSPLSPIEAPLAKNGGFFAKDGAWRDVLGALADGMAGAAGQQPTYGPNKMRMRQQQAEWQRQDALRRQDRSWAE